MIDWKAPKAHERIDILEARVAELEARAAPDSLLRLQKENNHLRAREKKIGDYARLLMKEELVSSNEWFIGVAIAELLGSRIG